MRRMHNVSISWLCDARKRDMFQLADCETSRMAADIFTKHFTNPEKWKHAITLIGMIHDRTKLKKLKSVATLAPKTCAAAVPSCLRPSRPRALAARIPMSGSMAEWPTLQTAAGRPAAGAEAASAARADKALKDTKKAGEHAESWRFYTSEACRSIMRMVHQSGLSSNDPDDFSAMKLILNTSKYGCGYSFWNELHLPLLQGGASSISAPPVPFELPKSFQYANFGDSGCKLYGAKKPRSINYELWNSHPKWTVGGTCQSGGTAADILALMKADPAFVNCKYDAVTVTCFLNGMVTYDKANKPIWQGEPREYEQQFRDMVTALRDSTPRPFLICAGTSEQWGYDSSYWGPVSTKYIHISRTLGVPCISGQERWQQFARHTDFVHITRCAEN